jgi:hypothetical protein
MLIQQSEVAGSAEDLQDFALFVLETLQNRNPEKLSQGWPEAIFRKPNSGNKYSERLRGTFPGAKK